MRGTTVAAAVFVLATAWAGVEAQPIPDPPPEVVAYTIQVHLDPATHALLGTESVRWRNTTANPTRELWLHLYLNAFSSNRSTFMRESRGRQLRSSRRVQSWGWTRLTSAALADGTDLLPTLSFQRPDDGNPDDYTVARLTLPREVPPGGAVELRLSFETRLPRVVARTGWAGDFHMVGQWFPKLGVLTDNGWNCHQFHANSEFFSDFGTYRVTVTLPEGWVVGATGVETSRRPVAEGSERGQEITFDAERVHDFAWAAAPASLMQVVEAEFDPARDVPAGWLEEAAELLQLSTSELDLPPVHLRLLIPRDQARLAQRELRAARLGMAWYGLHYGPYPYPQLTIVSPPAAAMEAGGMEYPTLITTGGSRWLYYPPMKWLPFLETVTIHEFGHQYFYGLLASNEFEQAWLDEGLNSYAEAACTAAVRRDRLVPEIEPLPADPWTMDRMNLIRRDAPLTVDTYSWKFRTRGEYFSASYDKTAVALRTLEGLIGAGPFARAMRHYAMTWRFRHPTGRDFQRALEESLGRDLGWFFDQAIRGDAEADWAVLAVRQRQPRGLEGWTWKDGQWVEAVTGGEEDPGEDAWDVEVEVGRLGELVGPLEVELRWDDGTRERRTWDGKGRWTRWRFSGAKRLEAVIADPDGAWALETRRHDNYWRREPSGSAVHEALWWTGELVRAAAGLLIPWS
jgi:hypothetical protein